MAYNAYRTQGSSNRYTGYVYGNTVRQMQAAPALEPQRRPERTPEQERQLNQRKAAAQRNRQRSMAMNGRYVLFLSAVTLLCAVVAGLFVMMQADVTANMRNIASLEAQISELKISNDATEKRLETTINLEEIKTDALALGMTYPAEDQIVTYSVEHTDYMNQFSAIP